MADRHPYIPASGYLVQTINHFRESFPATVTARTLKKLGIAPKNESYVLNILRFLELIDQEGNKTEPASKVFSQHDDTSFSKGFGKLVTKAYNDLFELHKNNAWGLETDALITFFRSSDETTALVGKLQASTFQLLAAFSGHGEIPEPKASTSKPTADTTKKKAAKVKGKPTSAKEHIPPTDSEKRINNVGLTVRIEINLPADGDQETYNRIFRSIRENLINE